MVIIEYWYLPDSDNVGGGEGCYFVPEPTSSTFAEMKRSSGPTKPCWRNNQKEEAQRRQHCNGDDRLLLLFKIIFLQLEFLGPDPESFHTELSLSVLRKPDIVLGITVMNEAWLSLTSSIYMWPSMPTSLSILLLTLPQSAINITLIIINITFMLIIYHSTSFAASEKISWSSIITCWSWWGHRKGQRQECFKL